MRILISELNPSFLPARAPPMAIRSPPPPALPLKGAAPLPRCRAPAPRPPLPDPKGKPGDWDSLPPGQYDWYGNFLIFQSGRARWRVPNPGLRSVMPGRPDSGPGDRPALPVPSPTIKRAFWRRNSQLKLAVFNDKDGGRVGSARDKWLGTKIIVVAFAKKWRLGGEKFSERVKAMKWSGREIWDDPEPLNRL